jgi:hypothetical protein
MRAGGSVWRLTAFAESQRLARRSIETSDSRRGLNFSPHRHTNRKGRSVPGSAFGAESNEQEIDQRDQGCSRANGDQDVVGADVGFRIKRRWAGFLVHLRRLGQAGRSFCEPGHIRRTFFKRRGRAGTGWRLLDWLGRGWRSKRQGQAMGQRLQPRRSAGYDKMWLSMLIDAMEEVSHSKARAVPCDPAVLAAVSAQLARPISPYPYCAPISTFETRPNLPAPIRRRFATADAARAR